MAIELKNICKSFGRQVVVNDISLTIPQGKITAFIGPNGAGKSTLLAIMSRLLKADQGEVILNGSPLHQQSSDEIARQLAVLKQSNHISLRLTVKELVAFGRFPYSKGRLTQTDHQIIENAIAYMNLSELQDKQIHTLSGGQRQRAYIAMILAQDTDYVLLDEPLNNLDMKHSVQIMRVLREMVEKLGKTVVIVIHDINFASCYADHIVAMQQGRVVAEGAVDTIMQTEVLTEIYDMPIPIHHINGQRIATYFR